MFQFVILYKVHPDLNGLVEMIVAMADILNGGNDPALMPLHPALHALQNYSLKFRCNDPWTSGRSISVGSSHAEARSEER